MGAQSGEETFGPRERAALGSTLTEDGVAFRVWAPYAEAVAVVGTFNSWNGAANPLRRDEWECWSGEVAGSKAGDEYRYEIRYRGETFTRIDPRARAVTSSNGNAIVVDPRFDWEGDDFTPARLEELVLYELHVGTFNAEQGPGTLRSAAARLGHLRALGVNGVTLMPVTEFVGEHGWGYDLSNLFAVEASYGGPVALKEFVRAAHREGIAVFLDVVYNHLGVEDNILWRFDGWHEGKYGGIYFYQDAKRADTPWGPRPDFNRREVREYVLDNVRMWLGEYRVDGLRVDGTFHMRTASRTEAGEGGHLPEGWSLLQEMTELARERFPRAILTAEDMRGDPTMTAPVRLGGAGFHVQWSDKFAHALRLPARKPKDVAQVVGAVQEALLIRYNGDPFQRIIFSESHDNAGRDGRLPAVADPDDPEGPFARRWAALAQGVVFTAPGVPQLFQGQEVVDPRDFLLKDPHELDLARMERFAGFMRFHQDLIALRWNAMGTTAGLTGPHIEIVRDDPAKGILVWRRSNQGGPEDDVLVVANFSREARIRERVGVPSAGVWWVRLDSESERYGKGLGAVAAGDASATPATGGDLSSEIEVTVGPWGIVVLSQDGESPGAGPGEDREAGDRERHGRFGAESGLTGSGRASARPHLRTTPESGDQ